jgi:hypothetical protein
MTGDIWRHFCEAAYTSAGHGFAPEICATSVLRGRNYADEMVEILLPTPSTMW